MAATLGPEIEGFITCAAHAAAERRSLAHHEAGHACIAMSLDVHVYYATIRPSYDCAGHVRHAAIRSMTVNQAVLIALAGPAATRRYLPWLETFEDDVLDPMGSFDVEQARILCAAFHGTDYVRDLVTVDLSRWRAQAAQLVGTHWRWICAVADALELRQELSGTEIVRLNPAAQFTARTRHHSAGANGC